MKRLAVVIIFFVAMFAAISLRAFSNPSSNLPECFLQGKGGKIEDLSTLCGAGGAGTVPSVQERSKQVPTAKPNTTSKPNINTYTTRDGAIVSVPAQWKVFPDGSISPSPGILVPSLYDIN